MTGRRAFLATLAAAAAGAVLDPERLLWVPGKRTIFLPTEPKLACPFPPISEEMQKAICESMKGMFSPENLAMAHRMMREPLQPDGWWP